MEPPKFQRKWEELNRALNRLEKFYLKYITDEDSFSGPKDYALTFFRVGYELKEALKKTSGIESLNGREGEVETFVNNNYVVSLGLDIANQEKHINLIQSRSNSKIGRILSHIHIFDPNGKDRTELTIEIDGVQKDCLEIAKDNLQKWKNFLESKNLI